MSKRQIKKNGRTYLQDDKTGQYAGQLPSAASPPEVNEKAVAAAETLSPADETAATVEDFYTAYQNRVIFIKTSSDDRDETEAETAAQYLPVITDVSQVKPGDVVIGRFSLFPFYEWIQEEVEAKGGELMVPYEDYQYIADMQQWYPDVEGITPRTWFGTDLAQIPADVNEFFVKGVTNSRKAVWSNAYAHDRDALQRIMNELQEDPFISQQTLAIREWVPLRTFYHLPNGMPITEEYRFFILNGKVMSSGYYWESQRETLATMGIELSPRNIPDEFLQDVIRRVQVNHYVVDIGVTAEGNPIVIELNDPSMSGLGGNDPNVLYRNIAEQ